MSFEALLKARFKSDPWPHQYAEFERSAHAAARAFIWAMRSGKTKETFDQASSQWDFGLIDCLVIFGPNGVHANWIERELEKHLWEGIDHEGFVWRTKVAGLKGNSLLPKLNAKTGELAFEAHRNGLSKADKAAWEDAHASWWAGFRRAIKSTHFLIFSFNSESMIRPDVRRALAIILAKRKVMMVWDESTDFAAPGSTRTKMSRAIARHTVSRRILDGTMLHQSPLDAFAQFELLAKGALGFTDHADFEHRYAEFDFERRGKREVRVITGLKHLEELRASIARYSSLVLREDINLPPLVVETRHIELSAEQERVYREVAKQIKVEVERGEVVSIGAQVSKIQKLQQVVGGWLIGEDKTRHRIPGVNPRLEALSQDVFYASGKVIVWCEFRHEIEETVARLRLDGWKVFDYYGATSDDDKRYVRTNFPSEQDKIIVVGQPQSMGRGVEIPAGTVIWYTHTFKARLRAQADERASVMGGSNVKVINYIAPGPDAYIIDRVAHNVSVADDVAGRGLKAVLKVINLGE